MNLSEIITAILSGDADENLNGVIEACQERRKTSARALFHTLRPGDRVRLIGGQKYLRGVLATVTSKGTKNVVVDLDEPRGRYFKMVNCPVELLEKVTA